MNYQSLSIILLLLTSFVIPLESRVYFLHIPKTGGTTLRLLLESQLSTQEIYPYRNTKSKVGPVKEKLVSGHFPFWFCQNLDDHFEEAFKITILREPIERYLSFLRAKKKADATLPDLESVLNLRLSKRNKYSAGLIDNAFCRYLTKDPSLEGEALLESAKQALNEFDCVIFFEQFESDLIYLFQRLGINLDSNEIPKINTTESEPVSIQLLERVKQLNELDSKLYEYAKSSLGKRSTLYPLRTSSFYHVTKKTQTVDYTFDQPLYGNGWTYRDLWNQTKIKNPIFRWVMNYPATIYFSLEKGQDYRLSFYAHSLTSECIPKVKVSGKDVKLIRLNTDLFSLYQGVIPRECIVSDFTEITFYSDKALHYREVHPKHYNRNHPSLSFALNRIQIVAVLLK